LAKLYVNMDWPTLRQNFYDNTERNAVSTSNLGTVPAYGLAPRESTEILGQVRRFEPKIF
jgi:hypothetical protein